MRKTALSTESPTFQMLAKTGLFRLLNNEKQQEIIQGMIDSHNQSMANVLKDAGC